MAENLEFKRVAVYTRVSTDEQATQGISLENQLTMAKNYCQLYGKHIVKVYTDAGVSGKEMTKRKALNELLEDAEKKFFDEVLVYKLTRLARNVRDTLWIYDRLASLNIDLTSITEKIDTSTPSGKMGFQIMASVAEFERNQISEVVRTNLIHRAKAGKHNGGSRPLGYAIEINTSSNSNGKNRLVVVEEEAKIVKKIFNLYCSGIGTVNIAKKLNGEGLRTTNGKIFTGLTVRYILNNPLYKGYVRYGLHRDWGTKHRAGKTDDYVLVKGDFDAIVTEEQWEESERLIALRKRKSVARASTGSYFLTGILRCPICGSTMHSNSSRYKTKDGVIHPSRNYTCSRKNYSAGLECSFGAIKAEWCEIAVIERIKKTLGTPTSIAALMKKIRELTEKPAKQVEKGKNRILAQIATRKQKIGRLVDLYATGQVDIDLINSKIEKLKSEINELEENEKMLQTKNLNVNVEIDETYIRSILGRLEEVLASASCEQKYLFFHLLVEKVTLKNRKVDKVFIRLGNSTQII